MYNSQLLKIVKSLSKIELRELDKYVSSPYFNNREDVTKLYTYLTAHLNSPPVIYGKERVFSHLFSNRSYDDALMRQLIHALLKVLKGYLVQKEIELSKTTYQLWLSKAFRRRGFDTSFEKELETAREENVLQVYRNAPYHLQNYLINFEKTDNISFSRRKGDIPLNDLAMSLTLFYASELFRLSSFSLSYQAVAQREFRLPLLSEVLVWFETSDFGRKHADFGENTEGVVLAIYYNVFKALETQHVGYFTELKLLLKDYWMLFPDNECYQIYTAALNFCVKRINSGEQIYLQHYFDLHESGLQNKQLFENGILSKFTYKNVITAALRLGKMDWVRQFIDDYKPFIHAKDREMAYSYNLANYYLHQKDYSHAQQLLQRADFGDIPTNLTVRAMQLRIYYDTDAYDALESLLDSYQVYIQRQKDLGYLKDNYLNMIKIVRKMLKTNLTDRPQKAALYEEVLELKNVVQKEWLLEKLRK